MEILKDFKNVLLNRREIQVAVEADKNPGFNDSVRFIASKFNAPAENIAVNNVKGKFGRKKFMIDASIYDSKETKEKFEPKSRKKEGNTGEKKPATEPKTEESAAMAQPKDSKDKKEGLQGEEPASGKEKLKEEKAAEQKERK